MKPWLKAISQTPAAWVRLASVVWSAKDRLELRFTVSAGKDGHEVDHWLVRVRGVRDFSICDANGGGIQMSGASHPAVRQFVEPSCALHFVGLVNAGEVASRLWQSHVAAVDDWIPIDRYLPPPARLNVLLAQRKGILCRGPKFLVRSYQSALTQSGAKTKVVAAPHKAIKRPPELLHFGDSYIVAEEFIANRDEQAG